MLEIVLTVNAITTLCQVKQQPTGCQIKAVFMTGDICSNEPLQMLIVFYRYMPDGMKDLCIYLQMFMCVNLHNVQLMKCLYTVDVSLAIHIHKNLISMNIPHVHSAIKSAVMTFKPRLAWKVL